MSLQQQKDNSVSRLAAGAPGIRDGRHITTIVWLQWSWFDRTARCIPIRAPLNSGVVTVTPAIEQTFAADRVQTKPAAWSVPRQVTGVILATTSTRRRCSRGGFSATFGSISGWPSFTPPPRPHKAKAQFQDQPRHPRDQTGQGTSGPDVHRLSQTDALSRRPASARRASAAIIFAKLQSKKD